MGEVLIARGSDVNAATVNGWIPLHFASLNGQLAAIEKLIAMGSDANAADTNGVTPLHSAARNGHAAAVEVLVTNGSEVKSVDSDGQTPLDAFLENVEELSNISLKDNARIRSMLSAHQIDRLNQQQTFR
eukprot:GILI01015830.1.p1 GENE.GILI01015830.1~~GILI01015830.1.p1  ORF type:complete len:130 (+),score=27.65 GILI01015830.1:3-392(+)